MINSEHRFRDNLIICIQSFDNVLFFGRNREPAVSEPRPSLNSLPPALSLRPPTRQP